MCAGLAYTETGGVRAMPGEGGATVMTEPVQAAPQSVSSQIPEDLALEIRRLAHDLSNALEIVTQTSYLLSTAELKAPASNWVQMMENGVSKALDINLALRNYIKAHSPR